MGQLAWEESYVGRVREKVGDMVLIITAVRVLIFDKEGRLLLIRRSDNGEWALPAGAQELGESISDCLKREVKEETGLDVIAAEPISLYTAPRYNFKTVYGKEYQSFALVFRVTEWKGTLLTSTTESTDAIFFNLSELPAIPPQHRETLDDLKNYKGKLILK